MLSSRGPRVPRFSVGVVESIRERAKDRSLHSDTAIAQEAGLDRSELSPVFNRKRSASRRVLLGLAKALGATVDEVLAGEWRQPVGASVRPMGPVERAAVQSRTHAEHGGGGGWLDDGPLISVEDAGAVAAYRAYEVTGECMVPEIHPGARVFVDTDCAPQDGDTVVFQLLESPAREVQLKRFYNRGADVHLATSRGEVQVYPWPHIRILGTVFQVSNPPPPRRPYPKGVA